MLVTPGNHDDPALIEAVFQEAAAISTRSVDVDGWRIILASSFDDGHHNGTFADETLSDLRALLAHEGHTLVGTHHPPVSPCSHPECTNHRSAEFLSMIDGFSNVAAVISGHLHLADEIERRRVRYLLGPSTALQLRHVHPLPEHNTEPTPGGARILELQPDGSLRTELVWA